MSKIVSMPSQADDSFLQSQKTEETDMITTCQCPLRLMTHFYITVGSALISALISVSMPSQADDSFLRYPFKNLGFMRFPEPIFAGICQNILTGPLFRACLQFGHI